MNLQHPLVIDTPYLRAAYRNKVFSFGRDDAETTVVMVGSCRIIPFLNYLRLHESKMKLICLNPVEMWDGPGHEVSDGVNKTLDGYHFGNVDVLICEHLQRCGALNTIRSVDQNIYDTLDCMPKQEIHLPNWNDMHIFDGEAMVHNPVGYGGLNHEDKVNHVRTQTEIHKKRWLSHCEGSSFPQLAHWSEDNWFDIRMGWTSNHPTLTMIHKMFGFIMKEMGLEISSDLMNHPVYNSDLYASTGYPLTSVDYEANHWKF